jgi:hypothetical protein
MFSWMFVLFNMLQTTVMEYEGGSSDLFQDLMSLGGTCTATVRVQCLFPVCQAGALTCCDYQHFVYRPFFYVSCVEQSFHFLKLQVH